MLTSIIPSHSIAVWLLKAIDDALTFIGLDKHQTLEQVLYFILILAISIAIGMAVKKLILLALNKFVKMHHTRVADELIQQRTLIKCAHIIQPLVFMALLPVAFDSSSPTLHLIFRITIAYALCTLAIGICAVLTFVFLHYNEKDNTRNLPIKGVLNIAKGIVWAIVLIVAISVLADKSPAALLGGLTAFAAVLMLIFKDTILGFVAGLQMSQNDMLHVGDWIVVPSTLANGTVEDVSLSTVKVRNFDNTLVMVPPYTLVSTSFQNWRGMTESGVRRVMMSIYINPDSVSAPDAPTLTAIGSRYPEMKGFIEGLQSSGKTVKWEPGTAPVNGTTETNLGLFRAYLGNYLASSEMVAHNRDMMVCIDKTSHEGVALQLYCFSVTTQWQQYEAVLSTIVEHAIAAAPAFGLEILSADHLNVSNKE